MGTLNVGTMTGRGRELADLMANRKVGVFCVQETRWKGNTAIELDRDCKLYYSGADERGRNWVGILYVGIRRQAELWLGSWREYRVRRKGNRFCDGV